MQRLLPPLLTALLLILMIAGGYWFQQTIVHGMPVRILGGTIGGFGLLLAIAAKRQFRQANTNVDTFEPPTTLMTSGWFQISRNPMYLGMLLMLIGSALLLNNIPALLGPLTFFAAATFWYIPYEEKDGLATFGEAYRKYCESVRRWV